MALDPFELMTIAAIGLVLFLWDPQKIPEIARTIGRAKKQFDDASKEFNRAAGQFASPAGGGIIEVLVNAGTNPPKPMPQLPSPSQKARAGPLGTTGASAARSLAAPGVAGTGSGPAVAGEKSADELLIDTARRLGIATEGKTRREISDLIVNARPA